MSISSQEKPKLDNPSRRQDHGTRGNALHFRKYKDRWNKKKIDALLDRADDAAINEGLSDLSKAELSRVADHLLALDDATPVYERVPEEHDPYDPEAPKDEDPDKPFDDTDRGVHRGDVVSAAMRTHRRASQKSEAQRTYDGGSGDDEYVEPPHTNWHIS